MNRNFEEDIFVEEVDPTADKLLDKYTQTNQFQVYAQPEWEWNIFGVPFGLTFTVAHISWWRRLVCKIFFGSTWKRIKEN